MDPNRPKLRALDVTVQGHGSRATVVLRDTEGVAPAAIELPMPMARVAARFDGRRTVERLARDAGLDEELVVDLARELDAALMLDSPVYRARRAEVERAFVASPRRPASHAGGAYHGEAAALARYIDDVCIAAAPPRSRPGALRAVAAPHMDLWRAAAGYGHAYRAVADALGPEVDTFVLLGTCHAPMRRPFAVCPKAFETPLGALEPDLDVAEALSRASRFDVRADEYLHKNEHSLEFQVVFLRHLLGDRRARIVPILCGLNEAQSARRDPTEDAAAESFVAALADIVDGLGERVAIVAGADLAHVGPRFGDPRPLDAGERADLAARDRGSIDLAVAGDPAGFFAQVTEDLDARRVCGLGPLYTMLRILPPATGEMLSYSQHIDPDEGSIVSHTSLAFWA